MIAIGSNVRGRWIKPPALAARTWHLADNLECSEKPLADGFLDGCEFPIGLVKLGLGRLRAKLGGYRSIFRICDTRLGQL
jgi:hypothetical protein